MVACRKKFCILTESLISPDVPCMAKANPPSLVPECKSHERQHSLPEERPDTRNTGPVQGFGVLTAPDPPAFALHLPGQHSSCAVPEVRVKGNPSFGRSCLYYL